ncbi:MAG: DUF4417 domain-containing protein [Eubacteriales bacterium]|nr:DUF4417 domain-containing protein [Eubacteriales bacterium]
MNEELLNQIDNEYEETKRINKQRIVRNEFASIGKYGMPFIKKQEIDLDKIELLNYTKTKMNDEANTNKAIHFFTYDWLFDTVYEKPDTSLEKLDQYYALLTPEFSLYNDMPLARQIDSVFKSRWCGAYWQKQGMSVIPTITWGSDLSFEFCFDGIDVGSIVAVSTYMREDSENQFMNGYDKMFDIIKPSAVICYGTPFSKMKGNIKYIDPYNKQELIKKMGFAKFTEKYLAGELYPEV